MYAMRALPLLLASLVTLGMACGEEAPVMDAAPDSALDARGDGAADAATDALDAGDASIACDGVFVDTVTGGIVDEDGSAAPGALAQVCIRTHPDRTLVCLDPSPADDGGVFEVSVLPVARCWSSAAIRVLLPEGGHATTYCEVAIDGAADGVLTISEPQVLHRALPATTLPPLGDASAPRTVVFDDGLEVDFVPDRLSVGVDYESAGARRIPLGDEVPCFARGADLDGLYGFSEEGDILGDGFAFRIPNATGLAAGSEVDLLLVGGLATVLADGTEVEEAELVVFGSGAVSADGTVITPNAGSELPYFTWLGYRAR